ncbi:MAG: hypothetical protein GXP04_07475 [Alphaproteobacteria bacterium]|nr:hypothetical protein [Alphaproteobacteria bacterium]
MMGLNPILIGATVLLAGAAILATAMLSPVNRAGNVYGMLVLMVGIYVGFAIIGLEPLESASRAEWTALMGESLLALVFVFAGLAVLNSDKPWLLGVMILAHGGVDFLHLVLAADYTPDWYAFLCLIFDAAVGVAAIWLLSDKPHKG